MKAIEDVCDGVVSFPGEAGLRALCGVGSRVDLERSAVGRRPPGCWIPLLQEKEALAAKNHLSRKLCM